METKQRHVVIVDDDQDIHDLITAFFKRKGFVITSFFNAESALAASQKEGARWDVVLADLNLPKMSGVELTVALKKNDPQLPVVLITTSKSAEVAVEAVRKGVYDFIVKPIHFPQLQISVERAFHLKDLSGDLSELRERVKNPGSLPKDIIGRSPKFLEALDVARRVARSKANIFISGESGTGKEVVARFVHNESVHSKGPFIAINCSAIPENLLESELFGHAKGAFTGAQDKKIGLFEEAQDGTLFLDEIGDLSLPLQAKLLRVLQEKKIKRVGENQTRTINCRIVSATHKNLAEEIAGGRFREDLYYRLNVIPITLPPLRERKEDLVPLAEAFLRRFVRENTSPARVFSKSALKFILDNPWRGNVRELENTIERAVVLARSEEVDLDDLRPLALTETRDAVSFSSRTELSQDEFRVPCEQGLPTLEQVIAEYVEFAVGRNEGARDKTAKEIGIDRKTLYKKLKQASSMNH